MLKKIYLELVAIKEELQSIWVQIRKANYMEEEKRAADKWVSGRMAMGKIYADNRLAEVKIEIYLSGDDWYKLRGKKFYKKLERYLNMQQEKGERQFRRDGSGGAPTPGYAIPCPPKPKRE